MTPDLILEEAKKLYAQYWSDGDYVLPWDTLSSQNILRWKLVAKHTLREKLMARIEECSNYGEDPRDTERRLNEYQQQLKDLEGL